MSYYNDVYLKRLNRYGNNYQARIQGQRERLFDNLLLKSPYRIDFMYDNISRPALLERYQQDDSKTIQYLLTRLDFTMPNGTILEITDENLNVQKWMILYLESIQASGYNRYFVLKMTHSLTWYKDNDFQSTAYSDIGYLYGPHNLALRDKDKNDSRISMFMENDNNYYIIMPTNINLLKNNYFELMVGDLKEQYRVVGIDRQTNNGVQYVTIDPIYEYDKSPTPQRPPGSTDPAYDWFDGEFGGKS